MHKGVAKHTDLGSPEGISLGLPLLHPARRSILQDFSADRASGGQASGGHASSGLGAVNNLDLSSWKVKRLETQIKLLIVADSPMFPANRSRPVSSDLRTTALGYLFLIALGT